MPSVRQALPSKANPSGLDRRTFLQAVGMATAAAALPGAAWAVPGSSDDERLLHLARQGLTSRPGPSRLPDDYRTRLEHELVVISRLGLSSSFLLWHDVASWARARGIPLHAGLGQASSSLVCWAIGLSELDPIEHGLCFERFINRRGVVSHPAAAPFFQLMVAGSRHHELYEHLCEHFGPARVALARSERDAASELLRDVEENLLALKHRNWPTRPDADVTPQAKAPAPVDSLSASAFAASWQGKPSWQPVTDLIAASPSLRAGMARHQVVAEQVELALELEPNLSVHAGPELVPGAAVLVSPGPDLPDETKIDLGGHSYRMASLSVRQAEAAGLQVLWLSPLAALDGESGSRRQGDVVDEAQAWQHLGRGEAAGSVGLESHMAGLLRAARPTSLDELSALFALARPGPINEGWLDAYLDVGSGGGLFILPRPEIEPCLRATRGLLLYHEQAIELAGDVAGMGAGEAVLMLKSLLKKRVVDVERCRQRFQAGAQARGHSLARGGSVFDLIESSSGLHLSKAWAISLAILALRDRMSRS